MIDIIGGEDAYWERRREEYENPRRFRPRAEQSEPEPVYELGNLYLDDELDEIEAEYQCPMEDLFETDLMEIVKRFRGFLPELAEWSRSRCAIRYYHSSQPDYC